MGGRVTTLVTLLIALVALPATAGAAGFGPTTSPLSETPPLASAPAAVVPSFNSLRIYTATTFVDVPTAGTVEDTNVSVAGNAAGDVLVAWTENSGSIHKAVALFWRKDAAPATLVAHELLSGGTVAAATPFAVLDPDRAATIVWPQASTLYQVTTADAGAASPWGAPTTELGAGSGMGARLPDGRAVYAFLHGYTNGPQTWFEALFSTRMPGQPFRSPASLAGGGSGLTPPARFAAVAGPPAIRAAISPAGRTLVSYIDLKNGDEVPTPCDPYDRQVHAVLSRVEPGAGPPSFSDQVVSESGDPDPQSLAGTVRAGPDDRLAMAWTEVTGGCWNTPNRPERRMAAYVAPGQTAMTATGPGIPGPPATFRDLYWKSDGQLLFWTQTTNPIVNSQTPYDTGVPITPVTGPPAGPGSPAAPAPAPVGAPAAGAGAPSPAVARRVTTKFVASSQGTVKMTIAAPSAGDLAIQLLAKQSGLIAAARPVLVRTYKRRVAKAGPVRLTLALSGRARRTLLKRGRLAITVRTTFKPAGGAATTTSTSTTFRLASGKR